MGIVGDGVFPTRICAECWRVFPAGGCVPAEGVFDCGGKTMFLKSLSKSIFFMVAAVLFSVGLSNYSKSVISAPELFGSGYVYTVRVRAFSVGVVDAWGRYLMIEHALGETKSQCLLLPLTNTVGDAQPVYCEKFHSAGRFAGFIYYRGHERPFCGGRSVPNSCLYTEPQ